MNIICAKNLNVYYKDMHALKDINIKIPKNKITALIGPSGCGKSTFIKTINRLNDLNSEVVITGDLYFKDMNIYKDKIDINALRSNIGMIFQKPNPFYMSIYDNIAYGPKLRGVKKKAELDVIVEESLTAAALWGEVKDRLKKSAAGLSGGQQQRLCIARALSVKPEVILMDEPTSALDPISTVKIEQLAITLKSKYTIIIVTHNMQQASRISDNTAFFLNGEIVEYDNTVKIFHISKNPKTADYVAGRFG